MSISADITTVGDKVKLKKDNVVGTVRFVGEIKGKAGIFYGVALDDKYKSKGKNNGYVGKKQYFKCKGKTGLFVQQKGIAKTNAKNNKSVPRVSVGAKVHCVKAKCKGMIKFIGVPYSLKKSGVYYGIVLEKPKGTTNGTVKQRYYFKCKPKYGAFLQERDFECHQQKLIKTRGKIPKKTPKKTPKKSKIKIKAKASDDTKEDKKDEDSKENNGQKQSAQTKKRVSEMSQTRTEQKGLIDGLENGLNRVRQLLSAKDAQIERLCQSQTNAQEMGALKQLLRVKEDTIVSMRVALEEQKRINQELMAKIENIQNTLANSENTENSPMRNGNASKTVDSVEMNGEIKVEDSVTVESKPEMNGGNESKESESIAFIAIEAKESDTDVTDTKETKGIEWIGTQKSSKEMESIAIQSNETKETESMETKENESTWEATWDSIAAMGCNEIKNPYLELLFLDENLVRNADIYSEAKQNTKTVIIDTRIRLLINGYIRTLKSDMNACDFWKLIKISDECTRFYFIEQIFTNIHNKYAQILENGTRIQSLGKGSVDICYASDKGYTKERHVWRLECIDCAEREIDMVNGVGHAIGVASDYINCVDCQINVLENSVFYDGYKGLIEFGKDKSEKKTKWGKGDIIVVILDCDRKKITFCKNEENVGVYDIDPKRTYYLIVQLNATSGYDYKVTQYC